MPVCLNRDPSGHELRKRTNGILGKTPAEFRETEAHCLDIGLVNNMPDKALGATERQFLTLLEDAAGGVVARLWLYALPDIPREDSGRRHLTTFYSGIEDLWNSHLDGLIVTGTEPRAANLADEPYWGSLVRVIEWADRGAASSVFSCLGAHAAVLHLDGIARRRLTAKQFGLFECGPVSGHPLTAGLPRRFRMPHSRWNDVPEDELAACGYRVLTRAEGAGVDAFARQRRSLSLFFQGHPEYEAHTLLLEYRRDVARFLRGERETHPDLPHRYFDPAAARALAAFRERALGDRRDELMADFPAASVETRLANTWRPAAARIYHNWLAYLREQKQQRLNGRPRRGLPLNGNGAVGANGPAPADRPRASDPQHSLDRIA